MICISKKFKVLNFHDLTKLGTHNKRKFNLQNSDVLGSF